MQLLRDLGPAISPFNAFLVVQGIETLSLRMERHVANALRVAECLEAARRGRQGRTTRAWRRRRGTRAQQKYAPKGAGAVLTFELHGGREAGQKFVEALELHSHVANIGDVRSLVIHPASTTHSQLTAGGAAHHRRHARAWCAWPSAWRASRTSWPTWRPASAPPRRA